MPILKKLYLLYMFFHLLAKRKHYVYFMLWNKGRRSCIAFWFSIYFITFCDGEKILFLEERKQNKTNWISAIKALNIISALESFGAEGFIQTRHFYGLSTTVTGHLGIYRACKEVFQYFEVAITFFFPHSKQLDSG